METNGMNTFTGASASLLKTIFVKILILYKIRNTKIPILPISPLPEECHEVCKNKKKKKEYVKYK
jgi:hypothetical protein